MNLINPTRLRTSLAPAIWGLVLLAGAGSSDAQTTVILVRHAERGAESMEGDPPLSEAGLARAQELLRVVAELDIRAVYATPFERTRETARPVAEHFAVEITETPISETMLQDMVRVLTQDHEGEAVLVVGHSNTIPVLVNLLTGSHYAQLEEEKFDDLFVVILTGGRGVATRLRYGSPIP